VTFTYCTASVGVGLAVIVMLMAPCPWGPCSLLVARCSLVRGREGERAHAPLFSLPLPAEARQGKARGNRGDARGLHSGEARRYIRILLSFALVSIMPAGRR